MSNMPMEHVHLFINFAAKELGLRTLPKIRLVGNEENTKDSFGHFLGTRTTNSMVVRVTNRHPIDVMRTISHELIHYKQRLSGQISSEMMKEDEANALAGRIMRKFDLTHPQVFRDKSISSIKEDGALGGVAANAVGDSSPSNPNSAIAQPENKLMKKILKRRKEMAEGLLGVPSIKSPISTLMKGNIVDPASANEKKKLRDIVGPSGHEVELEKRAETRIS